MGGRVSEYHPPRLGNPYASLQQSFIANKFRLHLLREVLHPAAEEVMQGPQRQTHASVMSRR